MLSSHLTAAKEQHVRPHYITASVYADYDAVVAHFIRSLLARSSSCRFFMRSCSSSSCLFVANSSLPIFFRVASCCCFRASISCVSKRSLLTRSSRVPDPSYLLLCCFKGNCLCLLLLLQPSHLPLMLLHCQRVFDVLFAHPFHLRLSARERRDIALANGLD